MPLDRKDVEKNAGQHIAFLQRSRHVSDKEKREIRAMHEKTAAKIERKAKRK